MVRQGRFNPQSPRKSFWEPDYCLNRAWRGGAFTFTVLIRTNPASFQWLGVTDGLTSVSGDFPRDSRKKGRT